MSATRRGLPVPDPERVIADAREEMVGHLLDAVRLHCVWLRQLEQRLREAGLEHEALRTREGRVVLTSRADACLTTTERIDVGDL